MHLEKHERNKKCNKLLSIAKLLLPIYFCRFSLWWKVKLSILYFTWKFTQPFDWQGSCFGGIFILFSWFLFQSAFCNLYFSNGALHSKRSVRTFVSFRFVGLTKPANARFSNSVRLIALSLSASAVLALFSLYFRRVHAHATCTCSRPKQRAKLRSAIMKLLHNQIVFSFPLIGDIFREFISQR